MAIYNNIRKSELISIRTLFEMFQNNIELLPIDHKEIPKFSMNFEESSVCNFNGLIECITFISITISFQYCLNSYMNSNVCSCTLYNEIVAWRSVDTISRSKVNLLRLQKNILDVICFHTKRIKHKNRY